MSADRRRPRLSWAAIKIALGGGPLESVWVTLASVVIPSILCGALILCWR